MFNECKEFFESRIGEVYGTYEIADHIDFENYLIEQKLDIDNLEFDLEDLIDEWIQQDQIYNSCLH